MRVLLSIHHQLDPDSGAPGATLALGEALRKLGEEVEFLSFDDLPLELPFLAANLAYPYFAATRMAAAARRGTDLVDASTGDAWAWARARRRSGTALVTRSHGLEHLFQQLELERAEREGRKPSWRYPLYWGGWRLREVAMSLRAADLVFVLSEEEREFAVAELGVDPERVRLTANGIPDSFLAAAAETAAGPGGPAVAMLGAHRPLKGIDHGAEALAAVLAADPELQVSFLGSGAADAPTRERFPAATRDRVANLESYRRAELPALLRGHSILLAPSFSEGFSLALVEAMACGLAPVAADIPGHRAIVRDGINGLLVAPGDAAAASAAILRLRGDAELLERLRTAAAETARQHTWARIAAQTAAAYEEAVELRRLTLANGSIR
jgi:glycosyltransferase involved in cell wall biosynthesis